MRKKKRTPDAPVRIPRHFNPGTAIHPYTDLHGMRWEQDEEGNWWITVEITPKLFNPNRVLHGGVLFTLADSAMGRTLTGLLKPGETCASIEVKINHIKMVTGGKLKARASIVNRGRRVVVMESEIFDENGGLVSKALGTMYVMQADRIARPGTG